MSFTALLLGLLTALSAPGQQSKQIPPKPAPAPARGASRTRMDAAARRNENVALYEIDNDAIKEANIRLGANVTIVPEARAEAGYYAAEHGRRPSESVIVNRVEAPPAWHADWFEFHQNGAFNARTFFQVGEVLPSRGNNYGGRFTAKGGKLGHVTLNVTQRKIRAVVNGNVLVPTADERTPLATDPTVRAIVARFLAGYPAALPNRPDFDPRALNTNSPQRIDEIDATVRLDRDAGERGRLTFDYTPRRQRTDAFQLVAGQNPDTQIHSHRARATCRYVFSPAAEAAFGVTFNRLKSVLLPEPNAVGPRVRLGTQFEDLGPDGMFPVNRAQNTFRWGALLSRQTAGGRHALTFGGEMSRFQLNGIETTNQRGYYQFGNNWGRTAVENLRMGTANTYEVTIGELARGFRNLSAAVFFGDRWKVNSRLQISYGLRYEPVTAPVEVNTLSRIPYRCDCNNFGPRFSIAWQPGGGWVARASYAVSFGEIPPVTYQQVRNNLPVVRYIQVQNPYLADPLRGINLNDPNGRTSPTILAPDMVSAYSHQYNFSLERKFLDRYLVRLGYVGSRSYKLMNSYVMNRAEPVPDIPLTTATVDQRRPDPRYYEIKHIVNGGIAYMDAAQAAIELPQRKGLTFNASYTFGKAIDEGSDYAFTAANKDNTSGRSQSQYDSLKDKKGLSLFDSTHALLLAYSYDLPRVAAAHGRAAWLADGWQVSGVTLLKSGTPLTLYVGSDAPGFGNVDGSPSDRPNILDPSILGMTIDHPNTAPLTLRRDRFAFIVPGERRGSLGRCTFRKDGIANFNAAVTKQWRWSGRREWTVLLRGEAYNLTNHPQFDEPQRNYSSPSFGKITNTLNDGRVLQLGLRLVL